MTPLYNSFHLTESHFFSKISFEKIDYGNMVAYATGVQASGLNPVIVNAIDSDFEKNLASCENFYAGKNIPWTLVIPDYLYNEALDNSLDTEGLSFTGNGVAMMTTELQKRQSPSSTLLDIKEMKNDLKAWSAPLIAFDAGSEVSNTYAERHRLASEAGVTLYHFSGFINNIAVCSLSLSINGGYARLDDISTLPAFQKKGYATELIDVVLKHLQALNINTCFLEASPEGLNLYKRMGFTELFVNRYYEQSNLS